MASNTEWLFMAINSGNIRTFDLALKLNKNISITDANENTPLHVACLSGFKYAVLKLIELGADVNATNKWKQTPAHCAVKKHPDIVKILLENGADFYSSDSRKNSVLDLCFLYGRNDIIEKVLKE